MKYLILIMRSILWTLVILGVTTTINAAISNNREMVDENKDSYKDIPKEYLSYLFGADKEEGECYCYNIKEFQNKIIITYKIKSKEKNLKSENITSNANKNEYFQIDEGNNAFKDLQSIYETSISNFKINILIAPTDAFDDTIGVGKSLNKTKTLLTIFDGDKMIWNITSNERYKDEILDVKWADKNNKCIVLFIKTELYIEKSSISDVTYVDFISDKHINKKPVVDRFIMPIPYIISYNSGLKTMHPISGKILTDNIIRMEYANGCVEHWKIRLSKEDIEKNKKINSADEPNKRLIWWNGIKKEPSLVNNETVKAWDYNDNSSVEPVYDNML